MTQYEQSDGFVPNKQTPPATSKLGASDAKWDEVNATTVSGTTINAAALTLLNKNVPAYFSVVGDVPAGVVGLEVVHGLNNSGVIVQVYKGGAVGGRYVEGSGTNAAVTGGHYIVEASGANSVYLYAESALASVNVIVIG
jgi:hypothetical protein